MSEVDMLAAFYFAKARDRTRREKTIHGLRAGQTRGNRDAEWVRYIKQLLRLLA